MAVGNRGPEIKKQKRFIAVSLRNALLEADRKNKGKLNVHHVCDNMVRIAKQHYDDHAAISATKLLIETIEGKAAQDVNINARVASITADMTPAEAAKLYAATLVEQLPDE